jgi:hypothetical protein
MVRFSPTFFPTLLIDYCDLLLDYTFTNRNDHDRPSLALASDDELGLEMSRVPDVFLYRNPDGHHTNEERGKEQQERRGRKMTAGLRHARLESPGMSLFSFFFFFLH